MVKANVFSAGYVLKLTAKAFAVYAVVSCGLFYAGWLIFHLPKAMGVGFFWRPIALACGLTPVFVLFYLKELRKKQRLAEKRAGQAGMAENGAR